MSTEYKFKAEINELMNLIINSLYSDHDIFLRELIANSADAINKLKYDILLNNENKSFPDFHICYSLNLEEYIKIGFQSFWFYQKSS